jgi:hypothetical protein
MNLPLFTRLLAALAVLVALTGVDPKRDAYHERADSLGNVMIDSDTTWAEGTYDIATLSITNGATLSVAGGSTLNVSGRLTLTDNSTLLLQGKNTATPVDGEWQGLGVTINADDVSVEMGSTISADGQGYVGTAGPGAGGSDTHCGAPTAGGGGGYGGAGGDGQFGARGGSAYGSPIMPADPGSGGGNNPGCNVTSTVNGGGGAIVLNVAGALQLDGAITANAAVALPARLGGGSGGSIYVTTDTLSGSGSFLANGADGGSASAGGGAGGRIAVYYAKAPSYTGFLASAANGGAGFTAGQPGTVAFVDTSTPETNLQVYRDLVFGEDSNINYDAITVQNGATLRVGGGSIVDVSGPLTLTGNSTLLLEGKNTSARVNGEWRGEGSTINAGSVTVQEGSTISADGQGYIGTAGPGAGESDIHCGAPTAGGGGGYGGAGGDGEFGAHGGSVYGSPIMPTDLGSGGGNNPGCNVTSTVNVGGGAIVLNIAGALQLDGAITANAAAALPARLGGGAGGSIYITTDRLTGSGSFSANGASGGSDTSGGGGGGRITVYYARGAAFGGFGASMASGGGGYIAGEGGTVSFVDTVCDGNCNGDSTVSIGELVRAVNIALGLLPLDVCQAADSDGNGIITVDDLVRAVSRALNGCTAG